MYVENVNRDSQSLTLGFVYLEPKDGCNVEIIITGDSTKPNISGTVVGMPEGIRHFDELGRISVAGCLSTSGIIAFTIILVAFRAQIVRITDIISVNILSLLISFTLTAGITISLFWAKGIFTGAKIPENLRV
jgi:hypothetical protein